jgi:hypothetical protein
MDNLHAYSVRKITSYKMENAFQPIVETRLSDSPSTEYNSKPFS